MKSSALLMRRALAIVAIGLLLFSSGPPSVAQPIGAAGPNAAHRSTRPPSNQIAARSIDAMPIPHGARRQLKNLLAARPAGSSLSSCADAQFNNTLVGYGGTGCTVTEGPTAFFNCTWNLSESSPLVNVHASPMNINPETTSVISFDIPANTSQTMQQYSVSGTCETVSFSFTIEALPYPERPCGRCGANYVGAPIDMTTGEEYYRLTDFAFSGPFGLSFVRSYGNETIGQNYLGANWQDNYDARIDVSQIANSEAANYDSSGLPHYFSGVSAGGAASYDDITGMTLALNAAKTQYTLTDFSSNVATFDANGYLTSLADRYGNTQTVARDQTAGHAERISSVTDPLSRKLCFFYDGSNRITEVAWLASGACPASAPKSGTILKLAYDTGTNCATGDLCSATEPDGKTWTYQYDTANTAFPTNLTKVLDPQGDAEESTTYGSATSGYWAVQQESGNCSGTPPCADTGSDLTFAYPQDGSVTTTVTDGEGRTSTATYDPNTLMLTNVTGPICRCGGDQTRNYTFDASQRLMTVSDDGVNGSPDHTLTYSYGRDNGSTTYPGATKIVENLDTSGTTRTTSYMYYPIGTSLQDLPQTTTLPSVDVPGATMSIVDTYASNGTLTQRSKTGLVNGVSTTYTWKWTYDSRGRMRTATLPRTAPAEVTTYAYFSDTDSDHARAGQLQTITDALKHETTYSGASGFTSYTPFGDAQSVTDPNGVVRESTFDARGRLLTSTLLGVTGDPTNLVTKWTYDGAGRLTSAQRPAGNSVAITYDTSNRVTRATRKDANALQQERLTLTYNANDQKVGYTAQRCATPAASCSTWTTTWSKTYGYSPTTSDLIKITNPDGTYRQIAYTDQGGVATYNDENHTTGSNYTYGYDVAGRKLSRSRKSGSTTIASAFAYDLHDNVNSITDENGNVTTYHLDDFDRVTKIVSPVQGTSTYVHDADGNLTSQTDADGAKTTYTYDALDRETGNSAVKGSQTLASNWTYDDPAAGHYGIGHVETMTDPSGSTTYTYERRGMIASEAKTIVGNAFPLSYSYDANGNRATVVYPDAKVVAYTYDFADRPYSAQQSGNDARPAAARAVPHPATPEAARGSFVHTSAGVAIPGRTLATNVGGTRTPKSLAAMSPVRPRPRTSSPTVFVSAATYEPFGPIASLSYGNGTVQTLAYNTRYFPTENKLVGTATLADYGYTEDAVGNITSITDKVNAGYDRTFKYDDLNRLTTATSGASLWGSATGNGYSFDAMGNVQKVQLGTGRTEAFSYVGTLPKLSVATENGTARSIAYDAFGNETGDGKSTFTYSSRELLATDSRFVSTYYYNGFRQRVSTQLATGGEYRDSIFDPDLHLISETNQFATAPSIAYDYVYFGDRAVAQLDSGGTHWTFGDHLGTPLIQTDATPAISWQTEYEPFGNVWAVRAGATLHQPLRLPGQTSEQFDAGANGLTERSYNYSRWYRPAWGDYAEPDFAGIKVSPNLYDYADDRPENWYDRLGFSPDCVAPTYAAIEGWKSNMQHVLGCYCGQHWTMGENLSEDDVTPEQIMNGPTPLGAIDTCCQTHDACVSRIDRGTVPDKNGKKCTDCDRPLASCVANSWNPGSNAGLPFSVFISSLVTGHFIGPAAQFHDCEPRRTPGNPGCR